MKKVFSLLILIIALGFVTHAQSAFHQTASNPTGAVVNTAVDTLTYSLSASYSLVSIQPVMTKVSGTVAGTSILQISVNGVNFVNTDTLTNTNVTTNTVIWEKRTTSKYFRILSTGSGTMSATVAAKLTVK